MASPSIFDSAPPDDDTSPNYGLISPDVIRTIAGEGDPAHIASVLYNRKAKSGRNYDSLINDTNQFEARTGDAWAKNSKLAEDDPRYQKILAVAGPILTGQVKPVTDADSFYSPTVQAAKGRSKPAFDDGTGEKGPDGQLYFKGQYAPPSSPSIFDGDHPSDTGLTLDTSPATVGPDVGVTNTVTNNRIGNAAQQLALRKMQAIGDLTDDPKGGSLYKGSPIYTPASAEEAKNVPNGQYYLDPTGQIQYAGEKKGELGTGALAGAGDVALTLANALPGTQDSEIRQRLQANQNQFDASNKGNWVSDLGRFGGQVAATAPVLGAVGGLGAGLARAAPATAPAMEFLGGTATGNPLLRLASQGVSGALQGGTTAGLTSSTSNQPLGQQVLEGGIGGAIANPLLQHVGGGIVNALTPTVSSRIAGLADKAANEFGIDLRPHQIQSAVDNHTGGVTNPASKLQDARLVGTPGSSSAKNADLQGPQGTTAIGSTFGVQPHEMLDGLTPQVMQAAKTRIGGVMNDVADRTNITKTGDLLTSVSDLAKQAKTEGLNKDEMSVIQNRFRDINSAINKGKGTLSGTAYKALIADGSPLDNATESSNANIRRYAQKIRNTLDTALQAEATPEDAQALQTARLQYKNMMTVAPLASKYRSTGIIPLGDLQGAVNTNFRNNAFQGAGKLGDLADIGQLFPNPSTSDKPASSITKKALLAAELAGGLGTSLFTHDPKFATAAAALGVGGVAANSVKNIASDAMNTNAFMRNRLIQNSLNSKKLNPVSSFIASNFTVPPVALGATNAFRR